jgi:hypothetical protein
MLQGHAIQKFHGDESVPAFFPDVVDGADVGMIERGSSLSLSPETAQGLGVAGNLIGQELQGYETVQPSVLGLVDDAHSPAADFLYNAVMRNGSPDHRRKMLRLGSGPVNESLGVGGISRGRWRRIAISPSTPRRPVLPASVYSRHR